MSLLELGNYLFAMAATAAILFTISFLLFSRWYRSWVGILVCLFMSSIAAIMSMSMIRLLTGFDSQEFLLVRLIVFALFSITLWVSVVSFWWIQLGPKARSIYEKIKSKSGKQD